MSTRVGCLLLDFANHQSVDAGSSAAAEEYGQCLEAADGLVGLVGLRVNERLRVDGCEAETTSLGRGICKGEVL